MPNPVRAPAGANCGAHIDSTVSARKTRSRSPWPRANIALMKRERSVTVVYNEPAGDSPSWKPGAGKRRPSYVHM